MRYSRIVKQHFHGPVNAYRMEAPTVTGVAGQPNKGSFLILYLRLEGDRIAEASFQTYGCPPAIAAGSLLAQELAGATRDEATRWTAERVEGALGGLPPNKRHCAALAADALWDAVSYWSEPDRASLPPSSEQVAEIGERE